MARGVQVSGRRLFRELGDSALSLRDPRVGTSIGYALYANAGDQRRALHRPFRSLRDVLLSRVHSQVEGSTTEDDLRVEVLRIVEYFYAPCRRSPLLQRRRSQSSLSDSGIPATPPAHKKVRIMPSGTMELLFKSRRGRVGNL